MKNNQMYEAVPLKRWVFIYPKRTANDCETFLKLLREVAEGMRYDMADPKMEEMPDDRPATYTSYLEKYISKDPKLIMIVVPNIAADRYAAIKRLTCVNNAIPTQVIVAKTMQPKGKSGMSGVKSIASKVMIQLNCKLGGAPWMIKFPIKGVMAVGFDVTHDTSDRSKSYGAFVASMDLKASVKFYSAATAHKDGSELSHNIAIHMLAAVKQFRDIHGAFPERIFYYRDGVGDGQVSSSIISN